MEDIFKQVEKNIDNLVINNVEWAMPATQEQIQAARNGHLELSFFDKSVPDEWISGIKGKNVLCLAGAGGLQAVLLACAGANVTVVDISQKMLDKDREIAAKEGLDIRIIHGNMCDLTQFGKDFFDYIINPLSLMYVPDVKVVFKECYHILKKGGCFIMAAPNPVAYICDFVDDGKGGYYKAVNRLPYAAGNPGSQDTWIEYGHTMEEYIGGQIACGFVITGYIECQQEDITELYFMTKADKL
jgi:2-polyprenyl-3-methyl-5-hydroxy-6-metoxy-1,4-benzoquinol methylase